MPREERVRVDFTGTIAERRTEPVEQVAERFNVAAEQIRAETQPAEVDEEDRAAEAARESAVNSAAQPAVATGEENPPQEVAVAAPRPTARLRRVYANRPLDPNAMELVARAVVNRESPERLRYAPETIAFNGCGPSYVGEHGDSGGTISYSNYVIGLRYKDIQQVIAERDQLGQRPLNTFEMRMLEIEFLRREVEQQAMRRTYIDNTAAAAMNAMLLHTAPPASSRDRTELIERVSTAAHEVAVAMLKARRALIDSEVGKELGL